MRRFFLITLSIAVTACNTFATLDPEDATDTGSDVGPLTDADGADGSTATDASETDIGVADMGVAFDPTPVAVDANRGSSRQHIDINITDRPTGTFDDNINFLHRQGGLFELFWIAADGTPSGTQVLLEGNRMAYDLRVDMDIDMTSRLGAPLGDFAIAGMDVVRRSSSEVAYGVAGHNCASSDVGEQRWMAAYVGNTSVFEPSEQECGQRDRSMPFAWLPAVAGGFDPATGNNRPELLSYVAEGDLRVLDPAAEIGGSTQFPTRPDRGQWSIGTTGRLVMFPNSSYFEVLVWNPSEPSLPPIDMLPPNLVPGSILGAQATTDLVHLGEERYLFVFTTTDHQIHLIEYLFDPEGHTFTPIRVIDRIQSQDRVKAAKLVTYARGVALFYLEPDPENSMGERWTIQPYRIGTEVGRLQCSLVYEFPAILQDVYDVEFESYSPDPGVLAFVAAVHFSLGGVRSINVEGGIFDGL